MCEATAEYHRDSNPNGRFLETCVVVSDPNGRVQSSVRHEGFCAWAKANGAHEWTNKGHVRSAQRARLCHHQIPRHVFVGIKLTKTVTDFIDHEGNRYKSSRTKFLAGKHRAFIGGKWVDAVSGKTFDTFDPGFAQVAECDAPDVDKAVAAAERAAHTARVGARQVRPTRSRYRQPGCGADRSATPCSSIRGLAFRTKQPGARYRDFGAPEGSSQRPQPMAVPVTGDSHQVLILAARQYRPPPVSAGASMPRPARPQSWPG